MTWAAWILAIILLTVVLWWWGRRPAVHRVPVENLRKYLQVLLDRGYPGGFMVIKETRRWRHQRRFVQFSKYVRSPGTFGIELAFPLCDWSEQSYPQLKQVLTQDGIRYRVERTGRDDTREFLNVDFARDLDAAGKIARAVLQDMFGLSRNSLVHVHYENVSPHEEVIDR